MTFTKYMYYDVIGLYQIHVCVLCIVFVWNVYVK